MGAPSGLLGGLGLGDRVPNDFGGLDPLAIDRLADTSCYRRYGRHIVGFRDEYGTVKYGTDPNVRHIRQTCPDTNSRLIQPSTPARLNAHDGYMFDEDLQACRLAGGLPGGDGGVVTTPGLPPAAMRVWDCSM
jgi:hypothetical protein